MKKSTGIVFLVVVVLAAVAYFYDWKRHPSAPEENPNDVKLAFTIKPDDEVNNITVTRGRTSMNFVLRNDGWYMTSPLMGRADQTAVADLAHDFGTVVEDRTLPATPDLLKSYGLDNPKLDMQFKLRNGGTHSIRTGAGDFSGLEVYSQVEGDTKNVVLITKNVAVAGDHSLEDFRDHSVLNFSYYEVSAFDLHNSSGEIGAKKQGQTWQIVKPVEIPGASNDIASLLQAVMTAKLTHFVEDNAKGQRALLAKYGLENPAARLDVTVASGKSTELLLGKKSGSDYYAMDTTRGMIFQVPASLQTTLDKKLSDLESKVLFTGSEIDVARLEFRGPDGTTTKCIKDSTGNMVIEQAAAASGQAPDCPDFLTPLETAKAQKVDNQPSDAVRAKFTKPAIVVTLGINARTSANTSAQSKSPAVQETKFEISAPAGNLVYAKSSVGPAVYEFNKADMDALFAKPGAVTPEQK